MGEHAKIKEVEPALQWPRPFFFHMDELLSEKQPGYTEPHSHKMYILNLLYEGTLPHYADFEQKPIKGPALLALNPDQVHIHAATTGCKVCSLAFAPDFIHSDSKEMSVYLLSIFTQYAVQLSANDLDELDTYIQLIRREYDKQAQCDLMVIKMLLNVILIYSHKIITGSADRGKPKDDLYYRFLNLIRKNAARSHQVSVYAKDLNVSTDVLNQVIRESSSKSPKQIIDDHLILEAKRILHWTESTIKETAWELGFDTDSYFNRFFKKFTGITPKQFREQRLK